jgi:predicted RNA binding protein YcfA (HicA-like mRNA interferase family)
MLPLPSQYRLAKLTSNTSFRGVLEGGTKLPYPVIIMKAGDFIKAIRRLGRKRGIAVRLQRGHGKGSHGRLYYGDQFTTVKDRNKDLGPGLLSAMVRQLGLTREDLDS